MLKRFWVKVDLLMDQGDTLHIFRYMYWSEVLFCTIMVHLRDLESRSWVIDFNRFSGKAQVRRATLSCYSSH